MADHSPATRAAIQAFDARYELCGPCDDNWQELCLAAALQALADHQHRIFSVWTRQKLRNLTTEVGKMN